jgi:hypothetical protein
MAVRQTLTALLPAVDFHLSSVILGEAHARYVADLVDRDSERAIRRLIALLVLRPARRRLNGSSVRGAEHGNRA